MPIEIKELVIRTVLESGSKTSGGSSKAEVEQEVKKQLKKYREEIISHCIEAVNEGIKRQQER